MHQRIVAYERMNWSNFMTACIELWTTAFRLIHQIVRYVKLHETHVLENQNINWTSNQHPSALHETHWIGTRIFSQSIRVSKITAHASINIKSGMGDRCLLFYADDFVFWLRFVQFMAKLIWSWFRNYFRQFSLCLGLLKHDEFPDTLWIWSYDVLLNAFSLVMYCTQGWNPFALFTLFVIYGCRLRRKLLALPPLTATGYAAHQQLARALKSRIFWLCLCLVTETVLLALQLVFNTTETTPFAFQYFLSSSVAVRVPRSLSYLTILYSYRKSMQPVGKDDTGRTISLLRESKPPWQHVAYGEIRYWLNG